MGERSPPDLDATAIRWCIRRRDPAWSAADEDAYAAWLRADPAHAAAAARIADLDELLGSAVDPAEVARVLARPARRKRSVRPLLPMIALLLTAGAAWWVLRPARMPAPTGADAGTIYRTAIGEFRSLVLDDGTQVELDADTRIRWRPVADARHLDLEQGRALFTVVHDPARPFQVAVGTRTIEDLGTVFTVDRRVATVVVAVTAGRVRVSQPSGQTPGAIAVADLQAGETATLGSGIQVEPSGPDVAAWRTGRLVFHDRTLADIAAEVDRYHRGAIQVDPAVAELRLSGTFRRDAPSAIIAAITGVLPVTAEPQPDGTVRLRGRDAHRQPGLAPPPDPH